MSVPFRPTQLAFNFASLVSVPRKLIPSGEPDLGSYSKILVAFSGGKDSLASVLYLLDRGVPRERIELWHHDVDGREGSTLMDWPVTRSYCQAIADALGLRIYYSWREGGFETELLKDEARTKAVVFEQPDGTLGRAGGEHGALATRRRFPQQGATLRTRWCSSVLKIDVMDVAIRNQQRFEGERTLVVTGERAEESAARAKYLEFETHRTDTRNGTRRRRLVDHWRPILHWEEREVWKIIERYRVQPHPCYRLGWSRASCAACIFSNSDHWASLQIVLPEVLGQVAAHEASFDVTIARDKKTVCQRAAAGRAFQMDPAVIAEARSTNWAGPAILPEGAWVLPLGAFGSPDSGPC